MSKKREQLIKTTIRLFAKEGVGVATARIAKEAKVSNGTLFNQFGSKQALIDSVYLHIKSGMANEVLASFDMDQALHDLFLDVWLSFSKWHREHPQEVAALELLKSSQLLTDEVKERGSDAWSRVAQKVQDGIDQGILVHVPAELIFLTSEGVLNAALHHASQRKLSAEETEALITESFGIFWRGISAEHAKR